MKVIKRLNNIELPLTEDYIANAFIKDPVSFKTNTQDS